LRLLIISHTPHYMDGDQVVGWGSTLREIDHLAILFDEVVHIAPLHQGSPPKSALPYTAPNIVFHPVPFSGGDHWRDKIGILKHYPIYGQEICRALRQIDVVHVRCPANISLLAIVLLAFSRRPQYRWVKYAGNWKPNGREPITYRFQRFWLDRNLHRGIVTINGNWPGQPKHVITFQNPCLRKEEIDQPPGSKNKQLELPLNLLFAGAIRKTKGVEEVLKIAQSLVKKNIPFELHLVGDGEDRPAYEYWVREAGLENQVIFHGWLPRQSLPTFYQKAHILIFPSHTEGWPKVLSEGMAYGVVPIASNVSSIPQILSETGAGVSLAVNDINAYIETICDFAVHPDRWQRYSQAGKIAAHNFTYEAYLEAVKQMFENAWGIQLTTSDV
jgi:glycosyltransferase involved in cell wall biosynthesis